MSPENGEQSAGEGTVCSEIPLQIVCNVALVFPHTESGGVRDE